MKNYYYLIMLFLLIFGGACSSDLEYESNKDDEENVEITEEIRTWASMFLNPEVEDKIIVIKGDVVTGEVERTYTARYIPVGTEDISRAQTREENDNKWIYYGEVSSMIDAAKVYRYLEEKFPGQTYEIRLEPAGNGKKGLYYCKG